MTNRAPRKEQQRIQQGGDIHLITFAPFGVDGDNVNYVLIHAPFRADEEQYTKFLRAPSRGCAKEKKCKKKINS